MNVLFTTKEAATLLGVCHQRVRKLAVLRKVGKKLASGAWVFTPADIRAMEIRKPGRPPKNISQEE